MQSSIPLSDAVACGRLAGILLLVIAPLALGADDAYLREIEQDAKRQATILLIQQAPPQIVEAPATDAGGDRLATNLDREGFEKALRQTLPGTYTLYQQLDPDRREQAYLAYRSDSRFTNVSERVIQLLGGKP